MFNFGLTLCRFFFFLFLNSGSFAEALLHYEKGIENNDSIHVNGDNKLTNSMVDMEEHMLLCRAGIARTSIKNGDYQKGVSSIFP